MTPLETLLDGLNKKYGFLATVLVRRDGRFLARVGDPQEPFWDDPYNVLFRDAETIANTFDFLAQEPPPRAWAQGTREVLLFKPREDLVLGAVKDDPRGAVEMFELSVRINRELPALFEGIDLG